MVTFSKRRKIAEKYQKWFEDNYRVDEHYVLLDDYETFLGYLTKNNLLNEIEIDKFIRR